MSFASRGSRIASIASSSCRRRSSCGLGGHRAGQSLLACVAPVSLTTARPTVQPGGTIKVIGRETAPGAPIEIRLNAPDGPVLLTVTGQPGGMSSKWEADVTIPASTPEPRLASMEVGSGPSTVSLVLLALAAAAGGLLLVGGLTALAAPSRGPSRSASRRGSCPDPASPSPFPPWRRPTAVATSPFC